MKMMSFLRSGLLLLIVYGAVSICNADDDECEQGEYFHLENGCTECRICADDTEVSPCSHFSDTQCRMSPVEDKLYIHKVATKETERDSLNNERNPRKDMRNSPTRVRFNANADEIAIVGLGVLAVALICTVVVLSLRLRRALTNRNTSPSKPSQKSPYRKMVSARTSSMSSGEHDDDDVTVTLNVESKDYTTAENA